MSDLIPVRMRDCRCVGQPHADGDFAYLKPGADLEIGLAAHQVLAQAIGAQSQNGSSLTGEQALEMMQIKLGMAYTVHGIARWNLLDEHGQQIPVNAATVNALKWQDIMPVADKAALLYSEEVLVPLAASLPRSSQRGQTGASTSASPSSSRRRQKRSKRSTTASTHNPQRLSESTAGDSSTSPSLE